MKLNDTSSLLAFLHSRKSGSAKAMGGVGPTAEQRNVILQLAVRVPDHGKLAPWRFIVFEGASRTGIGARFRARWAVLNPGHGEEALAFQAALFLRAPLVVAVVATAKPHVKIPVSEQLQSASAVCFNLVMAAQAHGFDAQWQSDWVAYDAVAKTDMGVAADEQVVGLIYIGRATAPLEDRPRPDAAPLTTVWSG